MFGAELGLLGISIAYQLVGDPERRRDRAAPGSPRSRLLLAQVVLRRGHRHFSIVRPFAMSGRFAARRFERVVVDGALVGGTSGAVRAASAAVRGVQSGFLRYYAALLLVGVTALGPYFLISA